MKYDVENTHKAGHPCTVLLNGVPDIPVLWFDPEKGLACVYVNDGNGKPMVYRRDGATEWVTAVFYGNVSAVWGENGPPPVSGQEDKRVPVTMVKDGASVYWIDGHDHVGAVESFGEEVGASARFYMAVPCDQLCQDEGCEHRGTEHVCNPERPRAALRKAQQGARV